MGFTELSIVLQGPTDLGGREVAAKAVRTARQTFPGAEIIVSCWDGNRTSAVESLADKVVTSPDPGPQRHSHGVLNVNRQLVSSRTGTLAATRHYVLKARSDMAFRQPRLWTAYLEHQARFLANGRTDPILITNLTTVNPRLYRRYLCLCDWVYLARREIAIEIFSAPFFPDDYLSYELGGERLLRFNAEQWITINFLARRGLDLDLLTDGYRTGGAIADAHHDLVGQYFALTSYFRMGVATQKHRIRSFSLDCMYTDREWAEEFEGKRHEFDPERAIISVAYSRVPRAIGQLAKKYRRA